MKMTLPTSLKVNLVGLKKFGHTCYLNSVVLQCVCRNNKFRSLFLCRPVPYGEICREIQKLCRVLTSGSQAFAPVAFKAAISKVHERYRTNQDQDAHEFLVQLLGCLHNEMEQWPDACSSILQDFFFEEVKSYTCRKCGEVLIKNQHPTPVLSFSLPPRHHNSLLQCLQNYCFGQDLEVFRCSHCQCKSSAIEKTTFISLASTLIIHLKRFDFQHGQGFKDRRPIQCPMEFTPQSLGWNVVQRKTFKLVGFICHFGELISEGHYIAYHKVHERWFKFNDSVVTEVPGCGLATSSAYLLFYSVEDGQTSSVLKEATSSQVPPLVGRTASIGGSGVPPERFSVEDDIQRGRQRAPVTEIPSRKRQRTVPPIQPKGQRQGGVRVIVDRVAPNYFETLDDVAKGRYLEKISWIDGVDPYKLPEKDSCNPEDLPKVTYCDIVNYLVYKINAFTCQDFQNYKSMEAFTQYASGFVSNIWVHHLKDFIVVLAKVLHSQSVSEKPLVSWVIAATDGRILTAHCTCMAGLGESCTHVAATMFAVEDINRLTAQMPPPLAVTDVFAYWRIPGLKSVPFARVKDINFGTPQSILASRLEEDTPPLRHRLHPGTPLRLRQQEDFLKKIESLTGRPALLSNFTPFPRLTDSGSYTPDLTQLFKEDYQREQLDVLQAIGLCLDLSVSAEKALALEKATRSQAKSSLCYRAGRVTASNFKPACRTSLPEPALSTLKKICYPAKMKFTTRATAWGRRHE